MEQLEFFDIPSPCVGVCQNNARGYCQGCFRTRDERFYWFQLNNTQRRLVLRACKIRRHRSIKKQEASPEVLACEQLALF